MKSPPHWERVFGGTLAGPSVEFVNDEYIFGMVHETITPAGKYNLVAYAVTESSERVVELLRAFPLSSMERQRATFGDPVCRPLVEADRGIILRAGLRCLGSRSNMGPYVTVYDECDTVACGREAIERFAQISGMHGAEKGKRQPDWKVEPA